MACSLQLKRNGINVGDARSATTLTNFQEKFGQLKVGGELLKKDQGGTVTIECSGTVSCSTCGRAITPPAVTTIE